MPKCDQNNSKRYRSFYCSIAALALSTIYASNASANEGSADEQDATSGVKEILVTAQRREQRLQDVGVSVTAIGAEDLRALAVVDTREIIKAIPGALLDNSFGGGASSANLIIRGVALTDLSPNQESPNSIYFDDVYLSSPAMAAFTTYDLDRVEVLRGPQGTLFGRASSGGLANFISKKPSREFNGYAEIGIASHTNVWGEAAVGGPLSDTTRFRIAGRAEKADGWVNNTAANGQDGYNTKFFGVRAQLEQDVTDKLNARIAISYDKNPRTVQAGFYIVPTYLVPCATCASGRQSAILPPGVNAYGTGPGRDKFGNRPTGSVHDIPFSPGTFVEKDRFAPTLYINYDLGQAEISSISSYTNFDFAYAEDDDGSAAEIIGFLYSLKTKQYSQELKISGTSDLLKYTAGFYYLHTDLNSRQQYVIFGNTPDYLNLADQKMSSWALFGQTEYQISPTLSATLGLRYTHERKTFDSKAYTNYTGGQPSNPGYDFSFENPLIGSKAIQSKGLWSGKFQLDYKPNDDTLLYISASRGVKAGGFNTNLSAFSDAAFVARTPFRDEHVYAYEGGAKLGLLENKLRINASSFYYDYHNFQGFAYVGIQGVVGNYDGRFYGGELEMAVAPAPDLDLNVGISYLNAKLYDVPTKFYGVVDREPASAPKWTINGSITKSFETPIGKLSINWNGYYLGDRYNSVDNDPGRFIPESFLHNARISLDVNNGLELAIFMKNISNVERLTTSSDTTASFGNWLQHFDRPRWIGGSIRKSF